MVSAWILRSAPDDEDADARRTDALLLDLYAALSCCKGLQQLQLGGVHSLTDLAFVPSSVVLLRIHGCANLKRLGERPNRAALRLLGLSALPPLTDVSTLASCPTLTRLCVDNCPALFTLPALDGFPRLERASLHQLPKRTYLSAPTTAFVLYHLILLDCAARERGWDALGQLRYIEVLALREVTNPADLSCLCACASLHQVDREGCRGLVDISALGSLQSAARPVAHATPPSPRCPEWKHLRG